MLRGIWWCNGCICCIGSGIWVWDCTSDGESGSTGLQPGVQGVWDVIDSARLALGVTGGGPCLAEGRGMIFRMNCLWSCRANWSCMASSRRFYMWYHTRCTTLLWNSWISGTMGSRSWMFLPNTICAGDRLVWGSGVLLYCHRPDATASVSISHSKSQHG